MPNVQPLIIYPGTKKFVFPFDKSGLIHVKRLEELELFCNFGFLTPDTHFQTVRVKCEDNKLFSYGNQYHEFKDFQCRKSGPIDTARRKRQICYNNATMIKVDYQIDARRITLFEACFDEKIEQTYYTKYRFVPGNFENQHGVSRPSFSQGEFYLGKDIDKLFKTHRNTVAEIVGSQELMKKYIPDGTDLYLARGHLAAKADFIFGPHQVATFWYINTAPQWQTFNAKNWVSVEDGSRRLAGNRNLTLDIYSGTYGVTTLKDINGVEQELYLDPVQKKIPVPKIYYKILLNKADNSGIVLIGVNNPHLTLDEINKSYIFCKDVSDQIDYIPWKRENITLGYSYACGVNDFVRTVPHVRVSASKLLV